MFINRIALFQGISWIQLPRGKCDCLFISLRRRLRVFLGRKEKYRVRARTGEEKRRDLLSPLRVPIARSIKTNQRLPRRLRFRWLKRMMSLISSPRVHVICRTGVRRYTENVPWTAHERWTHAKVRVKKWSDGKVSWWSKSTLSFCFTGLFIGNVRVVVLFRFAIWWYYLCNSG